MEYHELPEPVRDASVSPDDPENGERWDHRHLDPSGVDPVECAACGSEMYRVPLADETCRYCGSDVCQVNKYGDVVHEEYVNDKGAPEIGYDLELEADDADASGVICGHCSQRFEGNSIVVSMPDGATFGAEFEGTVIRDASPYGEGDHASLAEAPDIVWDILKELVLGKRYVRVDGWRGHTEGPSDAGGLTKVSGGWHSSMERSDLSARINLLNAGKLHEGRGMAPVKVNGEIYMEPSKATVAFEDALYDGESVEAEPYGLDVPVAVMFSRTSNICSIGIDVYCPETATDHLKELLDADAAPIHAGVH